MKKRQKINSLNTSLGSKSTNLSDHEKKYIYPCIPNSPIIFNKNQIIYGYGNTLLVFCKKENKFIKKIEEHKNAIRSLDISENKKYFLTTGDDKIIIIYDENWSIIQKIIHKKKIVKAYFLKYIEKETNKFEILLIDKYGDIYIYDLNNLRNKSNLINEKNKNEIIDNDFIMKKDEDIVKLTYLYDSLSEVNEKDEDLFFMKDFEHIYNENLENCMLDNNGDIKSDIETTNTENNDVLNLKNVKKMNDIKEKLEKHYFECFQNKNLLYPTLTCNSTVISLYYDEKFLIIGDRDEKIRIIKNKRLNKIYNFYLNHKLFITSVLLINEKTFCSSAADGYIYLWNIKTKEVIDYIYLDFNFLSKFIDIKSLFNNSINLDKYKFIVNILNFNENTYSIFATIENLKGIMIIPLIKNENSAFINFNKEKIFFFTLDYNILSFMLLNINSQNFIVFVDRNKGYLHQIKLGDDNNLNEEVATFDHSFFEDKNELDIGLINYWKHTTIEDIEN
ncbi:conserved Plasmodium protein, unknown function [Plasmodium gallinaceum]|uniref:WD repeat-containing protein n=1 Tax=Plasmodium gallinaceum TaxID=5849 RepID=A0A1J1GTI4_PLAGA|nr:conserved Plasmodium protein, unknown function [Plasmodium gallinaceum]CRG95609.1 conserved Plasmodium protein, unknown function [Plasmodium gallinaceum]